jgi:hypothetical protein
MKTKPASAEFDRFADFTRRLLSVPHSEIKAKLDAEKEAKRKPKGRASRASVSPSKPT